MGMVQRGNISLSRISVNFCRMIDGAYLIGTQYDWERANVKITVKKATTEMDRVISELEASITEPEAEMALAPHQVAPTAVRSAISVSILNTFLPKT